jgi:L-threonylcarbamoyladenylate synthase
VQTPAFLLSTAMAVIHQPTNESLRKLASVLREGGLVAVPTETVYGLAADALNPKACRKIFLAKERPLTDPLIVHVQSVAAAAKLAYVTPRARQLMRAFWPGPLTIVLRKRSIVPDVATAGGPTVALRSPAHPVIRQLLRLCGLPLAAPSANRFGHISPTTAEHVAAGLGHRIEHIVDGGPCSVGVESTIIDLSIPGQAQVLRVGGITTDELAAVVGQPVPILNQASKDSGPLRAPGLLTRHYSPDTPLRLYKSIKAARVARATAREGFLLFSEPEGGLPPSRAKVEMLSARGDAREAARRLFAALHRLDQAGLAQLHAEMAPDEGAGIAINDRLKRAAAKRSER